MEVSEVVTKNLFFEYYKDRKDLSIHAPDYSANGKIASVEHVR